MNGFNDKKDDFLVEMTLLGDNKAFEELVVRYENKVKGTAYKVTKNVYSAEDASQDAFVCAWVKLNCLRDRTKFGSWVCSIAKNCAVNLVRHYMNTSAEVSYELLENTDLLNELDNADISRQDRDTRLHEAVEALSEKIGETVKLHYFEGLSTEEIAKKLNISVGTVKWRLSEGRKRLRKEYGVMEDSKNTTFVQKVMYQVEQLKLWGLKNDKTGFEKEYRLVLKNIEELEESTEKQYALADVLARGYWWIDKERNEEIFKRIKEASAKSRNEDIMEFVINKEWNELDKSRDGKIEYMENTQVPYLIQKGFKKTLGYLYFWLAHELCSNSQFEKGIGYYKKVLETLTKDCTYYAAAVGAVHIEERKLREGVMPEYLAATGELLQYKDNKLYFMHQPGYSIGYCGDTDCVVFWNCSACDSMIFDESLNECESVISSDKMSTTACKGKSFTVDTPSGRYENCICYVTEGNFWGLNYCETYFCPKVGIVRQISQRFNNRMEWQLSKCVIKGGEEIIPFAEGNRWEYCLVNENGIIYDIESVFETVFAENGKANISHYTYTRILGYNESTWQGNIVKARRTYFDSQEDKLADIRPSFEKAEELAKTKREKLHISIAKNVMERIFDTAPSSNPNYTEKGFRNFFHRYDLCFADGKIIIDDNRSYGFEWKHSYPDDEIGKIVYDYFYHDLSDTAGTVWSDRWIEGYKELKEKEIDGEKQTEFSLEVFPAETIKTAAGEFTDCRHIRIEERRYTEWQAYLNGIKEYWFAPDIGIVKYLRKYKDDTLDAVWELTDYRGKGEGYFPVKDGLFRRYEPCDLKDGWHGWTEYTFDEDESGVVIFQNTLGTRDR